MTTEFGNIAKIMEATVSFVAKEIVVRRGSIETVCVCVRGVVVS